MRPLDVDAYYDRLEREWHEAQDEGRVEECDRCGEELSGLVGQLVCWACDEELAR